MHAGIPPPPRSRTPPQSRHPPRGRQSPPGADTPPGPGRPPHQAGRPQTRQTPPGPGRSPPGSRLQHTVNEWPVRILLECILGKCKIRCQLVKYITFPCCRFHRFFLNLNDTTRMKLHCGEIVKNCNVYG